MSSIIEKLDSYQIMTNLLPGAFFSIVLELIIGMAIPFQDVVEEIVIYYFIGLILNRIGSLVVKPVLKKCKFIVEAPYPEYVKAVKKDSKIDILSETNNYFRTLLAGAILLFTIYLCMNLETIWGWLISNWRWIALACSIILFLFAFRNQTDYVRKRVEAVNSQDE